MFPASQAVRSPSMSDAAPCPPFGSPRSNSLTQAVSSKTPSIRSFVHDPIFGLIFAAEWMKGCCSCSSSSLPIPSQPNQPRVIEWVDYWVQMSRGLGLAFLEDVCLGVHQIVEDLRYEGFGNLGLFGFWVSGAGTVDCAEIIR